MSDDWDDLFAELKNNKKEREQSFDEMNALSQDIKNFLSSDKITKFREYGPWEPKTEILVVPGIVDHWGIRTSHNRVIHYPGKSKSYLVSCIEEISIDEFLDGNKYERYGLKSKYDVFTPEEVIDRAISRLGEDEYNLVTNNCEHFVTWCVGGKAESSQVNGIRDTLIEWSLLHWFNKVF